MGNETKSAFARRLQELLDERKISGSDLARKIWGDAPPDKRGYVKAKGRDRMSNYLHGKIVPSEATLQKIAEALDADPDELKSLLPEEPRSGPGATPISGEPRKAPRHLRVTVDVSDPDIWHLEARVAVPHDVAREVMEILKPYTHPT